MNRKRFLIAIAVLFSVAFLFFHDTKTDLSSPKTSSPREVPAVKVTIIHQSPQPSPVSTPAQSVGQSPLATIGRDWNAHVEEPAAQAFFNWSEKYRAASLQEKNILEHEGVALAAERQKLISNLIQTDPERALELAVPIAMRRGFPASINVLLEQRISGRGQWAVMGVLPEPGKEALVVPTFRTASIDGKEFKAFAYGRRLGEPTRQDIPLNGIALGNLFAVNENPVRILEPIEAAEMTNDDEEICSVSGDATTVHEEETPVDVGGDIVFLCQPIHAEILNDEMIAAEGKTSSAAGVAASPYTEGQKKLILIRVDFPDLQGAPFADNIGTNLVNGLNSFYRESSYHRASFALVGQGTDYTPTFRLTTNASYYGTNDFYLRLRSDARAAATAAGYNLANYNFDLICIGSVPGFNWSGLGYVGAPGSWIRNSFGTGVSAHELGHNFGLNHAGFWDTAGLSVIGTNGTHVDYGDDFDTMGAANAGNNHFNARYKRHLDWLTTNEVVAVTNSGTYRIFCHDNTNSTGLRGLSVAKNSSTNYWIEFRQKFTSNRWLMSGAGLRWAQSGNQKSLLLDTTPGSPDGKTDAALVIGRTFSDKAAGVHITPIGKGGTTPESLDVVVNRGTFPANVPPMISIVANVTNLSVGTTANFSATATDANGDVLAYYWDFGDANFGTNGATASKSWSSSGEYVIRCTVTDMKGGVASDSAIVRVGSPSTFRISGTVRTNDLPIQGVRVFASSTRVTYTDSDGQYNLVGLTAGSYTINAQLDGYTFPVTTFQNPVSVGPNATGKDFNTSLLSPPVITAQPQGRAVAVGSNVVMNVTATNSGNLKYGWKFNGNHIANATNSVFTIFNAQLADGGIYSVIVSNATSATTSADAVLDVNAPPVLSTISNRTMTENASLTFVATAADTDGLTFQLEAGAPLGATMTSGGVFQWTPNENQGGATFQMSVRVTDDGTPQLYDTKSFTVTVNEANRAPVLTTISNMFVNAGETLTFTNFASDSDFPADSLSFSLGLDIFPEATLESNSGIFTWVAEHTETLVTNTISIVVTDNGVPALSSTNQFELVVIPAPQIGSMGASDDGSITLFWETFAGKTYQMQFKNSLEENSWTNFGNPVVADGTTLSIIDSSQLQSRFYRLQQLD